MSIRRRSIEAWGICTACHDMFTIFLWTRTARDGQIYARIEPNREVTVTDGEVRHRCGGSVRMVNLPYPCILEVS